MGRRTKGILPLLFAAVLSLVACQRKVIYSHYEPTPTDGWEKNDTLLFCVAPIRNSGSYREEVGLRINGAYPFMGLTLIVEQRTRHSLMMRSDTLHTRLIDRDGTIQGQGISYYQYDFHLADLHLMADDTLHVSIRHNMKREILTGVSDVGITLHSIN